MNLHCLSPGEAEMGVGAHRLHPTGDSGDRPERQGVGPRRLFVQEPKLLGNRAEEGSQKPISPCPEDRAVPRAASRAVTIW